MTERCNKREMPVPAPRVRNAIPKNTSAPELMNPRTPPLMTDNELYFSVDECLVDVRQHGVHASRQIVTQSLIDEFDPLAQSSKTSADVGPKQIEDHSCNVNDVELYDVPHHPPEPSFSPPPLPKLRNNAAIQNAPQLPPRVVPIPVPVRAENLSSSGSSTYDSALESVSDDRTASLDNCFDNSIYLCSAAFGDSVFYDVPCAVDDVPPRLPPRFSLNTVVPLPPGSMPMQNPPVPPRKPPLSHFMATDSTPADSALKLYEEVENELYRVENEEKNCKIKSPDFANQSGASCRYTNEYEDWPQSDSSHNSNVSEGTESSRSHLTSKLGWVQRINKNKKDSSKCWCMLTKESFKIQIDRYDNKPVTCAADTILTIENKDYTVNNTKLYCFDVIVQGVKSSQACTHTFGVNTLAERHDWVTCLWKCVTSSDKIADCMLLAVTKAGRFEYKEAVSGIWQPVWLALLERDLILWREDESDGMKIDLRKVKAIGHYKKDPRTEHTAVEGSDGTVFYVMYPGKTIYLRSFASSETDDMFKKVQFARLTVGDSIEDQFLTQDDVPVLVDKCITHVFHNGLQEEGIYRIAARNGAVDSLLDSLRKDPFQVILSQDYTVHEVANVLKRFFIKLPNPLLTNELAAEWQAVYVVNEEQKSEMCKILVSRLPRINFQTLRHLLAHLRSVIHCKEKNSMTAQNVAAVFGPTLLGSAACEGLQTAQELHNIGMQIMMLLLKYYETIFDVNEGDLQKEKIMLDLVQQSPLQRGNSFMRKKLSHNGILVSVYLDSKDWGDCIPFTLLPKMTAKDVVLEVMRYKKRSQKNMNLMLCEVVCNGELERLVHFNEFVLEVMSRWMTWDVEERRANYLLVKNCDLYNRLLPLNPYFMSLQCEVRLADAKTKSFKKVLLEFKNAKLSYFKDNKLSQAVGCWNIEDVAWYFGCESRRNAPSSFALTFIERNAAVKRTKHNPYFGTTVCMNSEEELHKWMAIMLISEHPDGIIPS